MKPSDIKRCPFCGSVKPVLWDEDKKEWVYFTAPLTDEEKESRDRKLKILEDAESLYEELL